MDTNKYSVTYVYCFFIIAQLNIFFYRVAYFCYCCHYILMLYL